MKDLLSREAGKILSSFFTFPNPNQTVAIFCVEHGRDNLVRNSRRWHIFHILLSSSNRIFACDQLGFHNSGFWWDPDLVVETVHPGLSAMNNKMLRKQEQIQTKCPWTEHLGAVILFEGRPQIFSFRNMVSRYVATSDVHIWSSRDFGAFFRRLRWGHLWMMLQQQLLQSFLSQHDPSSSPCKQKMCFVHFFRCFDFSRLSFWLHHDGNHSWLSDGEHESVLFSLQTHGHLWIGFHGGCNGSVSAWISLHLCWGRMELERQWKSVHHRW